jgi:hypothetical protein
MGGTHAQTMLNGVKVPESAEQTNKGVTTVGVQEKHVIFELAR